MSAALEDWVVEAQGGSRRALERVVAAVQDDVYGLALRFLGHPDDARDASQEILVKLVTRIGQFEGRSRFRTWVYRCAANHLVSLRRATRRPELDLESAHRLLGEAVLDSARRTPSSDPALVEEMKLACAHGMLVCLDRELRMAYILGVLLELPGQEAAEIAEVPEPTYRKRLERARSKMQAHLSPHCGWVDERNPCRCERMVETGAAFGVIDKDRLVYRQRLAAAELKHSTEQVLETTALLRRARYRAPESFVPLLRRMLDSLES